MGIQSFGEKFDLKKLYHARNVARDMAYELSSLFRPGMTENDAHRLYKELSEKHGIEKQWHPAKLRFGPNTICDFKDISRPHTLQEDDIFFIDIGPTVQGHEADYGETFVIGNNAEYQRIADISKKIFFEVAAYWKETKATGKALYEFGQTRAKLYGYHLGIDSDGHRIGDFPHHVFFKGGLPECEEEVVANAWILEIHLFNKDRTFGAFFEDILTSEVLDQ